MCVDGTITICPTNGAKRAALCISTARAVAERPVICAMSSTMRSCVSPGKRCVSSSNPGPISHSASFVVPREGRTNRSTTPGGSVQ